MAREHGILVIADEVQTGMGRTGKMFASEHFGFKPDMVTIAKGVASGLPLGLCAARESVMNWLPGAHASTFGGNPVSCATALTTIRLLEEKYMENARVQGERLSAALHTLMKKHPLIGDVRGFGLMLGTEIVTPDAVRGKNSAARDDIVDRAFEKGLLLLGCGDNTVRFAPPLVVSSEEVDTCLRLFEEVLSEIEAGGGASKN